MAVVKGKKNYQEYKGITFANETELEFYKMCEKAVDEGRIKSFQFEVRYELQEGYEDWRDNKIAPITHIPDFELVLNDGSHIIVDTKGADAFTHDEVAVIKRKIWMYSHKHIPYFMISKSPRYLGQVWVETSKGHDFLSKLKKVYDEMFPNINKRMASIPIYTPDKWWARFEFENMCGLFYVMNKMYTKKDLEKMKKMVAIPKKK